MVWITGWKRRRSITINGTSTSQSNYQMKITVHKGTGTDSSTDIYIGTNVRNDFGDVRFTKSDQITLLDYWIESYISGTSAVIWVEIDSIPASPSNGTIYIYYDNPSQTTTSDGSNTFDFFDDFNRADGAPGNGWIIDTGSVAISSGYLRLYSSGGSVITHKSQPNLMNGEWQWNFKFPYIQTSSTPDAEYSHFIDDGTNYYQFVQLNANDDTVPNKLAKNGTAIFRTYQLINDTNWHTVRITRYNGNFQIWIDGVSKGTGTDTSITSNTKFVLTIFGWGTTTHGIDYDNIRARKYVSPEPTFYVPYGIEEISQQFDAISMAGD